MLHPLKRVDELFESAELSIFPSYNFVSVYLILLSHRKVARPISRQEKKLLDSNAFWRCNLGNLKVIVFFYVLQVKYDTLRALQNVDSVLDIDLSVSKNY